jgi:hypothetical protein
MKRPHPIETTKKEMKRPHSAYDMEDKCMANMDESENARNKKLKKPQC